MQEAILCHELLHVRRRDWPFTMAEQAVRAVLWFIPPSGGSGQVQLAREQTVDGEVVALTGNRDQYLNALLAIAGNRPALDLAPAALFLRKRHLKNRVALLLKEVNMSKRSLISFCAASSAVLLAAGWFALHTFPLQAAPRPQDAATQSKLLHSVPPQYPQAALDKRIEGAVVLEAHIDAQGHVIDTKVLCGPEELRNAALQSLLQWHYNPEAMSLPATTEVTIDFKLPKNGPPQAGERPAAFDGPPFTLKGIQITGISDSARDQLLQRLPAHVGDNIDAAVLKSLADVARSFDDHLVVYPVRPTGTIQIFVPPPAPASSLGVKKIRVGGNVQQTKLVTKVTPVYPPEAKAQRIQGLVRLQATIDKTGKIAHLEVVSGDPLLAAAALDAVRQWEYETTLLNGDPVEVITQIDVNFTLSQ